MSWLDFVIVAVIAWFALAGLTAGILRESVTLIAAILGVVLAGLLYKQLADDLTIFTDSERVANLAAFIAIFAAVFLAGQIVATLLKGAAALLMLGPIDSIAGLVFGLLKGLIVVEAALILFAGYPVEFIKDAMDASLLTPFFFDGLPLLLTVLPSEFRNAVETFPS